MESHLHLIVVLAGFMGLFLGGWLIDADHSGSIKSKVDCIFNPKNCELHTDLQRGIFHKPAVAFTIIVFTLCFSISYLVHLLMDHFWKGI